MINIQKTENFPEISRSGRVSEELQAIIDSLHESAKTGDKFCITGVVKGKAYNSMQQRVRAQAKKLGYNIVIRYEADTESLFFKATSLNAEVKTGTNFASTVRINASDVSEVKPKAKTSK